MEEAVVTIRANSRRTPIQVTAELRWFWSEPQDEFRNWFCQAAEHDFAAGGGGKRIDSYLRDARQVELGLKHRGGRYGVEIKGLVAVTADGCTAMPFDGAIELWAKWTSETLLLDTSKTVTTEKQRWLRKFDTGSGPPMEIELESGKELSTEKIPEQGCNVEFTRVRFLDFASQEPLDTAVWWTLSFESFGSMESAHASVKNVAAVMASRNPPPFERSMRASYPMWLSMHAPETAVLEIAK